MNRSRSGNQPAAATARLTKSKSTLLGAAALGALVAAGALTDRAGTPFTPAYAQTAAAGPVTAPVPATSLPSFADVVDRVKPAVVSVRVRAGSVQTSSTGPGTGGRFSMPDFDLPDDNPFQDFFRRFRGDNDSAPRRFSQPQPQPQPRRGSAQGSGFFVSADGYLVTNNHVVSRASDVEVLMDDGRSLQAKVVGTDPKTDLALLKVAEGGPFPYVELAPDAPRVGDWVLAVGNPFGLGGTVTAGIVSARARDIGAGPYDDFLQVDAPVNRGNSGGPTFNLKGQVVGVNTAIASPSGGNVGIAFAIPSETVQQIVAQLKDKGTVERGFLGVQIQSVNRDMASSVGLQKPEGAIVAQVTENSPAATAGIKTGDVVLSVDGKPVRESRDLSRAIAFMDPGKSARLQVWRDGAMRELTVTIGRQSADATASAAATPSRSEADATGLGKIGLTLAPAGTVAGVDQKGVAVMNVEPNSPAAEKGFKTGDVIAQVAGQAVETPADVKKAIDAAVKDGKKAVLFRVEAKEGSRFIAVQVPAA